MRAVTAFWLDETGADMALPARFAKYALALVILNEIRGVIVVAGVLSAWFH